ERHKQRVPQHEAHTKRQRQIHEGELRVRQNVFTPGVLPPLNQEIHGYACASPLMARFTRFLINGILYSLCARGWAPRTARSPAILAVSSFRALPATAFSTAVSRIGCAATALTTMREL